MTALLHRGTAKPTAFFSGLCERVVPTHATMTELTAYVPTGKMKHATYRPTWLSVDAAATNPATATVKAAVICHVRSWNLPELYAKDTLATPARM